MPGDLPNPGIELRFLALQADSLPLSHVGSPLPPLHLANQITYRTEAVLSSESSAKIASIFFTSKQYSFNWAAMITLRQRCLSPSHLWYPHESRQHGALHTVSNSVHIHRLGKSKSRTRCEAGHVHSTGQRHQNSNGTELAEEARRGGGTGSGEIGQNHVKRSQGLCNQGWGARAQVQGADRQTKTMTHPKGRPG